MRDIARRLRFEALKQGAEALYREQTPAGEVGVVENSGAEDDETRVDLALLFGAAMKNRAGLTEIMNREDAN
jgi:hypothetical protein